MDRNVLVDTSKATYIQRAHQNMFSGRTAKVPVIDGAKIITIITW
jgi:hypothetical protein